MPEMKYVIYQVEPDTCEYCFDWWDWAKDKFNFKDYKKVYEGTIDAPELGPVAEQAALDKLFVRFNVAHPEDFRGHSLSVSDVVEINGRYWYCDSHGWVDVREYVVKSIYDED